jgi:sterol 3beta-glucosyltransferase
MRITILTLGTRGDVQPYLALGLGLQRAGHRVTLTTPVEFEPWIRRCGLDHAPLHLAPQAMLAHPEVRRVARGRNFLRMLATTRRVMGPLYLKLFQDYLRASQSADVIIAAGTALGAFDCAEKLSIPLICALLQPFPPTRAFPSFFLPPGPRLGGAFNWLSHLAFEQVLWLTYSDWSNAWRKRELGLPPLPFWGGPYRRILSCRIPILFGYSSLVLPKPPEWAPWHHVTGYWELAEPPDWQPPEALQRFLDAGPPPVYVGFGSMVGDDSAALTSVVIQALQRLGVRGVLLKGAAGLGADNSSGQFYPSDDLPHRWLFPRMAAIVHHGGSGTTGASLASGVPTLTVPFVLDQFGWGDCISALTGAPRPIAAHRLTTDNLATALDAMLHDPTARSRAVTLAERLRAEDGVTEAVRVIGKHLQ